MSEVCSFVASGITKPSFSLLSNLTLMRLKTEHVKPKHAFPSRWRISRGWLDNRVTHGLCSTEKTVSVERLSTGPIVLPGSSSKEDTVVFLL